MFGGQTSQCQVRLYVAHTHTNAQTTKHLTLPLSCHAFGDRNPLWLGETPQPGVADSVASTLLHVESTKTGRYQISQILIKKSEPSN